MNRTGIEYLTHTWNPYTGCLNWQNGVCGGGGKDFDCWAKGLAEGRLQRFYPSGFEPTFWHKRFLDPLRRSEPARIGVSFMGDLFGDWVEPNIRDGKSFREVSLHAGIFNIIRSCRQHTFVFLTKCPWNLVKWNPWPDNCWVGVSATDAVQFVQALASLRLVEARTKFISVEPLLEHIRFGLSDDILRGIHWVILGGKSGKGRFYPPEEWIQQFEQMADRVGIPIFEKDNLRPKGDWTPRREWPK